MFFVFWFVFAENFVVQSHQRLALVRTIIHKLVRKDVGMVHITCKRLNDTNNVAEVVVAMRLDDEDTVARMSVH